jgi:hypothetical protein
MLCLFGPPSGNGVCGIFRRAITAYVQGRICIGMAFWKVEGLIICETVVKCLYSDGEPGYESYLYLCIDLAILP